MRTSVNTSDNAWAIWVVTIRLAATTPPNAETESHSCAFVYASAISFPTAIPQGLACLIIATHGSA